MISGPNGSVKSTIIKRLDPEWIGTYVNADEIQKQLNSGSVDFARYQLEPSLESLLAFLQTTGFLAGRELPVISCSGSSFTFNRPDSYLAAAIADYIRHELVSNFRPLTFETVMSHQSKVDFFCSARTNGYRTYLCFICTESPEINLSRVALRVEKGGHDVPSEKVRDRYYRSLELLAPALECADRAYVFDNSGSAGSEHLLFELRDGRFTFHASVLPNWFQTYVLSRMDLR